jgi:serine/threonine protein kinase
MAELSHARTGMEANSLGKYCLIAGLGRGGMATVHLAVVRGPACFNKLVVIKQIHQQYADDLEVLGMFLDEAKLAARLSHPNVVQTNEVGQEGETHFLMMEYLDGQPLNRITQRLAKRGGLPLHMHLQVIVDLLGGLHYAHELTDYDGTPLGVVHRDITPQNIFVTYDGVVKIVDFGIAKARHALTQTRVGIIKGKIAYMAPEQARSDDVDRRADVFAVGVMLWEAATGVRPWKGVTEITLLRNLLAGQFPSARSVKPEIPEALDAIISRALAPDREDRYATAADLQAALEAYLLTTGERPQPRELGKLISTHFAVERTRIKAIIEEQLQSYGSMPVGASATLPIIDHTTLPDGDAPQRGRESSPSLPGEPSLVGSSPTRPSAVTPS